MSVAYLKIKINHVNQPCNGIRYTHDQLSLTRLQYLNLNQCVPG